MHRSLRRRTPVAFLSAISAAALAVTGAVALSPSAQAAAEQIPDGGFDNGLGSWYAYGVASGPEIVDGAACVTTNAGAGNPWDAAIGLNGIPTLADTGYQLTFRAKATASFVPNANFQHASGSYEVVAGGTPTVTSDWQTFTFSGTSPGAWDDGQVVFQIGGKGAFTFCIDDVSLQGGVEPPKYEPDTGPRVRVNQVAYLPQGPKGATVVTESTKAVAWTLNNKAGKAVLKGKTKPFGVDPTSGQNVQTIDFSNYVGSGTGFTITADGETSHPFDINAKAYEQLRKDSQTFFYTQRSGTPILDSVAPGYGRAAGHVGVAPNTGDTAVSCQKPAEFMNNWTCDASSKFDVTGGWYDAGDHGKYVVNGGIAVAQLLGEYERSLYASSADRGALDDGTLRVPENDNWVPDILDNARWELEWMLKMQVPASTDPGLAPYQGMAFHKVQDAAWTGLPLAPADDPQPRELHRPSTAATLNLAAAAAQGSRLFYNIDRAFAAKLMKASKTAYAAAKRVPDLYAPGADGNSGGGAYDDSNVTDEFYWAATELYLSTGDKNYADDVVNSPLHTADVFDPAGAFGWQSVAALARIDLATVPSKIAGRNAIRKSVLAGADKILAVQKAQAYDQPYAPADGNWVWGSNSNLLNNLVVVGTAYDISGAAKYRTAVLKGMDYVLGRNALNISYVTGYGTVFSENQHTRMYSNQLDPSLPHPPAGSIAGGPNTGLQDPVASAKLKGCAPQFCYIDDINSYATNEVAINWNSTLSWVSSFVADLDNGSN